MIEQLDAEIRACTRCANCLERHPVNPPGKAENVVPRPILSKPFSASVMLVGQAPGLSEYQSGLPFQGQAGSAIRALFAACGVQPNEFDHVVYQTSAVKCFPGRKLDRGSWKDRPVDRAMKRSCSGFLKNQIDVVNPHVLVCMGGVAADALDEIRGRPSRKLGDVVGTREEWGDRYIIFLAHTSGASFFLNGERNKRLQERGCKLLKLAVGILRNSDHLIRART